MKINQNKIKTTAMIITFLLIITSAIIFKQQFVLIVPLIISLAVMFLQADVNRYGYLLGSINSLIYAAVYIYLGTYGSVGNALLFSFPFQLATFFMWKKNAYKKSVKLKKLSAKARIIVSVLFIISYAVTLVILNSMGSKYLIFDTALFTFSFLISVLQVLTYIEFSYISLIYGLCSIAFNIQMSFDRPAQITYLIFSLYSYLCVTLSFINSKKLYAEQRNLKNENN